MKLFPLQASMFLDSSFTLMGKMYWFFCKGLAMVFLLWHQGYLLRPHFCMGWWLWFGGSGLYALTTRVFYRMHGQQKGNLAGGTTISKLKWICEMVFLMSFFPQTPLFSFYFRFIANWWSSLVLLYFALKPQSSNPESTADKGPSFHGRLVPQAEFAPSCWLV